MVKLYSQPLEKLLYTSISIGGIYSLIGVINFIEGSGIMLSIYIALGLFYISYYVYLWKNNKLKHHIAWDDDKMVLQAVGEKSISINFNAIQTIKVTDTNLIINAGMGNGAMIEIKDFRPHDKEFIRKTFEKYTTQAILAG